MSITIRPTKVAPPGHPHSGRPHRWRSFGAQILHAGKRRGQDIREVREVYTCEFDNCKELIVKIRRIDAGKVADCFRSSALKPKHSLNHKDRDCNASHTSKQYSFSETTLDDIIKQSKVCNVTREDTFQILTLYLGVSEEQAQSLLTKCYGEAK